MTEPTDAELIRYLAQRMGWEAFPLSRPGYEGAPNPRLIENVENNWNLFIDDGKSSPWNPLVSLDQCREVEEAVIPGNCAAYTEALRRQVGINYPIGSFGASDLLLIAMATARQRALALWEMRGK